MVIKLLWWFNGKSAHWYIYALKNWVIICLDNSLLPSQHQDFVSTNDGRLIINMPENSIQ